MQPQCKKKQIDLTGSEYGSADWLQMVSVLSFTCCAVKSLLEAPFITNEGLLRGMKKDPASRSFNTAVVEVSLLTWQVVDVASVHKQVSILWVTEWR